MPTERLSSSPRRPARAAVLTCWVVVTLAVLLGCRCAPGASAQAPPSASSSDPRGTPEPPRGAPAEPPGALGASEGRLPDAATVFDDAYPGVARLDPDLHAALR